MLTRDSGVGRNSRATESQLEELIGSLIAEGNRTEVELLLNDPTDHDVHRIALFHFAAEHFAMEKNLREDPRIFCVVITDLGRDGGHERYVPDDWVDTDNRLPQICRDLRPGHKSRQAVLNILGSMGLQGKSKKMYNVFDKALRYAKRSEPILLLGPTGAGKMVVAEFICKASANSANTIIGKNCSAIDLQHGQIIRGRRP